MEYDTRFIIALLIVLILSCVLGFMNFKMERKLTEGFDDAQVVDVYDPEKKEPIQSNRLFYFRVGLANFFTKHANVSHLSHPIFIGWVKEKVYIWPNAQDICCKTLEKNNDGEDVNCSCDNIVIEQSTCFDQSFSYVNENKMNTVQATIGATKKENCTMKILENNYQLVKRSASVQLNKPVDVVGSGQHKKYRLELKGNNVSVILSRPLIMSFSSNGLYRVLHEPSSDPTLLNEFENPKESNAFANYNSTRKTQTIYLEKILPQDVPELIIYPDATSSNIYRTFDKADQFVTLTMYYFNYGSEIQTYNGETHVTNIIINEKHYNDVFRNNDNIHITTGYDDSNIVRNVTVDKNNEGKISLRMDDKVYNLPEEFTYYDPHQYDKFDICMTLAYDIVLIYCFARNKVSKTNICFSKRIHHNKKFKINKDNLKQTFQNQAPEVLTYMQKDLREVMNISCIPNYAHLAYKLGYNFNLN